MRKAFVAMAVGAMLAATGIAGAQSPTISPAAVTAEASIAAAATAIQSAGKPGLISTGMLDFSFTTAGLTCPPGFTDPKYCTDNVGGGFRFIIRVIDIRPGAGNGRSVVIAAFLTVVGANQKVTIDCAGGDPCLSIRNVGLSILRYGVAHHKKVPVLLISHIRPRHMTTSTEVIEFLNL